MGFSLLQGFSHIELTKRQYQLYAVSFSPYFPTGFKGVFSNISYTLLSSYFSHRVFGGDDSKDDFRDDRSQGQGRIRGSVRN